MTSPARRFRDAALRAMTGAASGPGAGTAAGVRSDPVVAPTIASDGELASSANVCAFAFTAAKQVAHEHTTTTSRRNGACISIILRDGTSGGSKGGTLREPAAARQRKNGGD